MATLRNCIRKAGKALDPDDAARLVELRDEYVSEGFTPADAGEAAVNELISEARVEIESIIERVAERGGDAVPVLMELGLEGFSESLVPDAGEPVQMAPTSVRREEPEEAGPQPLAKAFGPGATHPAELYGIEGIRGDQVPVYSDRDVAVVAGGGVTGKRFAVDDDWQVGDALPGDVRDMALSDLQLVRRTATGPRVTGFTLDQALQGYQFSSRNARGGREDFRGNFSQNMINRLRTVARQIGEQPSALFTSGEGLPRTGMTFAERMQGVEADIDARRAAREADTTNLQQTAIETPSVPRATYDMITAAAEGVAQSVRQRFVDAGVETQAEGAYQATLFGYQQGGLVAQDIIDAEMDPEFAETVQPKWDDTPPEDERIANHKDQYQISYAQGFRDVRSGRLQEGGEPTQAPVTPPAEPTAPAAQPTSPEQQARTRRRQERKQRIQSAASGEQNTVFTKDKADAALSKLRDMAKDQRTGLDPELMAAMFERVGFHVERGARTFGEVAEAMIEEIGDWVVPYLKGAYNNVRDYPGFDSTGMDSAIGVDETYEADYVPSDRVNVESDRTALPDQVGQEPVQTEPGAAGPVPAQPSGDAVATGALDRPDTVVPEDDAAAGGAPGDLDLFSDTGEARYTGRPAGSDDASGSREPERERAQVERVRRDAAERDAGETPLARQQRADANRGSQSLADLASVLAEAPNLQEAQAQDVVKAEQRLINDYRPNASGFMLTNGTGTGKTFSGLGLIKRFANRGKRDILIVAPSQKVLDDWIETGRNFFDLPISLLSGVRDQGQGITATTYANLGENIDLVLRQFDLVVYDESHNLLQALDGEVNERTKQHFIMTRQPEWSYAYARTVRRDEVERIQQLRDAGNVDEADAANAVLEQELKDIQAEYMASQGDRPRVLFLSASPFASHKSIKYANTYLFDFDEGNRDETNAIKDHMVGYSYNSGDGYQSFMMEKFGYRMKYNKLTQPESGVDRALMERRFNEQLVEEGALSRRMLDIEPDYSREFHQYESKLGQQIDDGMRLIRGYRLDDEGHYEAITEETDPELYAKLELHKSARAFLVKKWDYHYLMSLLEGLNSRAAAQRAKQHIAMGRKVVVFHRYKTRTATHPFRYDGKPDDAAAAAYAQEQVGRGGGDEGGFERMRAEESVPELMESFSEAFPELSQMPLTGLSNPIVEFQREFGDRVAFFNGDASAAQRIADVKRFNEDNSGLDVIVVQYQAGKEGISLHDVTGGHQRALMSVGLPIQATDGIQMEGRTYRTGLVTNAIFEYMKSGLGFEEHAFAQKVALRSDTAENMAMGNDARNLETAYVDGYNDALLNEAPNENQGTGSKESDRMRREDTPWDIARSLYFGQKKKGQRDKAAEGIDYFPTPEPIGVKMVEWLDLEANERALEPSAGHGAIARFFPDNTTNIYVEPSLDLEPKLMLNARQGKVRTSKFEDFALQNKFHAIAMNPPFGKGGSTAMKHLAKASKHLYDGGRIVAIIPTGPAADKAFDKWFYDSEDELTKHLLLRADLTLPRVTFERAATQVAARIVVIDKIADDRAVDSMTRQRDLSGAQSVEELFERIEPLTMPLRSRPTFDESVGDSQAQQDEAEQVAPPATATEQLATHNQTHSKTGDDQFLVVTTGYLERDDWADINAQVKQRGGYYSRYKNKSLGIKNGWVFPDEDARDAFIRDMQAAGDKGAQMEQSPEDRPSFALPPSDPVSEILGEAELGVDDQIAALLERTPEFAQQTRPRGEPDAGIGVDVAKRAIADQVQNINNKLGIDVVVMHSNAMPSDVRSALPPDRVPAGAYYQNKIYLFADVLSDAKDAQVTLAHELVGHIGVNAVVGDRWAEVRGIYAALKDENSDAFREIYGDLVERYGADLDELTEVSEFIALAAEKRFADNEAEGTLRRFMRKIREFINQTLRQLGWKAPLSMNDIQRILAASERYVATGRGAAPGFAPDERIGFSLDDQYTPQEQEAIKGAFYHMADRPTRFKRRFDEIRANWVIRTRQYWIDQYDSIRTMLDDPRTWMKAQLAGNSWGSLEAGMEYGRLYLHEDGVIQVDQDKLSLKDLLSVLGEDMDRFFYWIVGNRADRLKAEDRENLMSQPQIDVLKRLNRDGKPGQPGYKEGRQALFNQVRKEFEAWGAAIVDIAVQQGLVNEEEAAVWREEGFYVPFYRVLNEDAEAVGPRTMGGAANMRLVRQQAYKRLKGGTALLDDPLSNAFSNWNHLLGAAMKNRAAREALASAEDMGLAKRISAKAGEGNKNATFVRVDGRPVWYEMDDSSDGRVVLSSLGAMSYQGMQGLPFQMLRKFKRAHTIGVTANPEFKIANLIRDTLQAVAVTDINKNFVANVAQGFKATRKTGEVYPQLLAAGGVFAESGYIHGADPDAIRALVRHGVERDTILDSRHVAKRAWHKYQDAGARLENVNRAAHFVQSRAAGDDLLVSAFGSRDHLDFTRRGSGLLARFLTDSVSFLNARIQGIDKVARSMKDPQQRKRFMVVWGAYSLASIAAYLAAMDEDDWDEIEDWERDTYHLVKSGDTWLRIPRPFELGVLANMVERGAEQFVDNEVEGRVWFERAGHALWETFKFQPIPQAAVPVLELLDNRSWFLDRPIETKGMEMSGVSKSERSRPQTSPTAIAVSKGLDAVVGEANNPLSPVQIEHLVYGYLGWAGATMLAGADILTRAAAGGPEQPAKKTTEYPIVRRFMKSADARRNTKYTTQFYDQFEEVQRVWANIRKYRKEGDRDKVREEIEENRDVLRTRGVVESTASALSKLRGAERRIYTNDELDPDAKRERLDELQRRKNQLTERAVKKMRELGES